MDYVDAKDGLCDVWSSASLTMDRHVAPHGLIHLRPACYVVPLLVSAWGLWKEMIIWGVKPDVMAYTAMMKVIPGTHSYC